MIRPARLSDGAQAISVLRQSITELCVDDHRGDPDILKNWLRNKTVSTFEAWLTNNAIRVRVAERDGEIIGVASATTSGEVLLNYVSPRARFGGVSSALVAHLETELFDTGLSQLSLWSTQTAHRFYRSKGWVDAGDAVTEDGTVSYPMRKPAPE